MTGDNVTEVNFGKAQREVAREFARLFGIVEAMEADILANPVEHLRVAMDRMAALQGGIRRAQEALLPPLALEPAGEVHYEPFRTLVVDQAQWERAQACIAIIESLEV